MKGLRRLIDIARVIDAQSTSRTYTPPMPKVFSNGVVDIVVRVAALAVVVVVEPQRARELVVQVVQGGLYVR